MTIRTRESAKNTLNSQVRIIQSQFENTCAPCGRRIGIGELIYYDRWSQHRMLCMVCGSRKAELSARGLAEIPPPADYQSHLDRISQIHTLPSPLDPSLTSELQSLLRTLRDDYSDHSDVRKFLVAQVVCAETNITFVCIRGKYAGFCVHCGARQRVGEVVFYDRRTHRIHCFNCDIPAFANQAFSSAISPI